MQVVAESLTIKETPVNSKLARLYLVSDILHNSTAAVPNASSFRSLYVFDPFLPILNGFFDPFSMTLLADFSQ